MKGNKLTILLIFIFGIACLGVGYYINSKINRIVVIDVIKILNEYEFKKELEGDAEGKLLVCETK